MHIQSERNKEVSDEYHISYIKYIYEYSQLPAATSKMLVNDPEKIKKPTD